MVQIEALQKEKTASEEAFEAEQEAKRAIEEEAENLQKEIASLGTSLDQERSVYLQKPSYDVPYYANLWKTHAAEAAAPILKDSFGAYNNDLISNDFKAKVSVSLCSI